MADNREEIKDTVDILETLERKMFTVKNHHRSVISTNQVVYMNRLVTLLRDNDSTPAKLKHYVKSIPRIHTNWDACKYWQRINNFGEKLY